METNPLKIGVLNAILLVAIVCAFSVNAAFGESLADACGAMLAEAGKSELLTSASARTLAQSEVHSPLELFTPGKDGKTLIEKHPWMIMSASQKALDVIYKTGVEEVVNPKTGEGTIKRYSLFSDAVPIANEKHIVGQLEGIERLVQSIESTADGNPTGVNVATLIGVPGTGKSWILSIFREALFNSTLRSEDQYDYKAGWINLHKIPSLRGQVPAYALEEPADPEHPIIFVDPMNDSPISFFSPELQDALLKKHESQVVERIGRRPRIKKNAFSPIRPDSQRDFRTG